jgi:hypothetical protein
MRSSSSTQWSIKPLPDLGAALFGGRSFKWLEHDHFHIRWRRERAAKDRAHHELHVELPQPPDLDRQWRSNDNI